ncbi:hypothetical protein Prudu_001786, partial [Prunus dulcis]
ALDICLTSFGDALIVRARNADQADYGPLNPANLLESNVFTLSDDIRYETTLDSQDMDTIAILVCYNGKW